jgi:RNA polymerase sigma-70 factor (ECF subfamily)
VDPGFSDISVDRLRAGDPLACREMVLRHHAAIYRFLFHLGRDACLAEELTTDVFAAAWAGLAKFDGRSSVGTWLHRIAYTRFIDSARREARRQRHTACQGRCHNLRQPPADPADGVEWNDQARMLKDLLGGLSAGDRALVLMHYTQRMSYAEIASVVAEPEGTVKWRMSRLLRTLREKLLETNDAPGPEQPAGSRA